MSSTDLHSYLVGRSAEAKLVILAAFAVTFETQSVSLDIESVKRLAELPSDVWDTALAEAIEWGAIFPVDGVHRLMCADDVFYRALGAPGRPNSRDWEALKRKLITAETYCTYCHTSEGPFVLDHVVPIAKGGSNHEANLFPACVPCNSAKGSMDWPEWAALMARRRR